MGYSTTSLPIYVFAFAHLIAVPKPAFNMLLVAMILKSSERQSSLAIRESASAYTAQWRITSGTTQLRMMGWCA
jgi:hypothetical protein